MRRSFGCSRVVAAEGVSSMSRSVRATRGFTILEVIVAVGITAIIAGLIVATVTNVSGFWSRTSGRISAESQARYVLDHLALDLQSALYRDDGNAWLAATILPNTSNTLTLWNTAGTTSTAIKPTNAAGSLQGIATAALSDVSPAGPRFGVAGTWLRFFTTKRGANPASSTATTTATSTSAPVAVAYQIVRRATTATPTNFDRRYLFHRSEVRPSGLSATQPGTLQAGFDITAAAYQPTASSTAVASPAEIRFPTLNSVIAENVIDFGVRMYVRTRNENSGALELTRIFPASNTDLTHTATLPPGIKNEANDHTNCFPEVIDVMVRVLTDEGARLIDGYEKSPQRITAPQGRTAQQYWWDLALANSQVFTRRIVLTAKPL